MDFSEVFYKNLITSRYTLELLIKDSHGDYHNKENYLMKSLFFSSHYSPFLLHHFILTKPLYNKTSSLVLPILDAEIIIFLTITWVTNGYPVRSKFICGYELKRIISAWLALVFSNDEEALLWIIRGIIIRFSAKSLSFCILKPCVVDPLFSSRYYRMKWSWGMVRHSCNCWQLLKRADGPEI